MSAARGRHVTRAACALGALLLLAAAPARPDGTLPLSAQSGPAVPAFVVDGGGQVRLSGSTRLVLDCDLKNFGAFTPAPGSAVVVRGYGSPTLLGVGTFADLSLALQGTVSIANSAAVTGTMSLGSGRLSLAGHDLTVNTFTGGSAASYVMTPDTLGRLSRVVTSLAPVSFPVGHSSYDPVTIRASIGGDVFRVAVIDAPPAGGLAPATALTRAWAVAQQNAPGANGLLTLSVQWNTGEQGASFDRTVGGPTSAWAWRWNGASWAPQPGVRRWDNGSWPAVDSLVSSLTGVWTLGGVTHLLGSESTPATPGVVELAPAFPNPSRGGTTLRFGLPRGGRVSLEIYSVRGERVAALADGELEPGWHTRRWDAARAPAGIYFARLVAGREARSAKLVIVE